MGKKKGKEKTKIIPSSVNEGVGNTILPVTEEIGTTLADIWFLVFGSIHERAEKKRKLYSYRIAQFEKELAEKIKNIPNDSTSDVDIQVIGTALEDAKYCLDKDIIRKMFVNLIAVSMSPQSKGKVHPAFSGILKQMDAFDASNLQLFAIKDNYPIVHYQVTHGKYSETLLKNVFLENPNCQDIYIQSTSISNLERLGLVKVFDDTFFFPKNESIYRRYYSTSYYLEQCEKFQESNGCSCVVYETYVEITPLGAAMLEICTE